MSSLGFISKISVVLLVVGLVVGGGAGYLTTSNMLQSKIRGFETQIAELGSEISSLTSTISNLESEKSNYETEISNLETTVSSLEAQVSGLEDQASASATQISALTSQISDLGSELDEAYGKISDYEGQVEYLESQVSSIQSVLETYVPDVFKIGMTATSRDSLAKVETVAAIAKRDINDYCLDEELPFTFDFMAVSNYDEANQAVENTIMFNSLGINLIVGHETSVECSLSLSYVNSHNMLMLSPSARGRELTIPGDNLFRTCPSEFAGTIVMAEALTSWGIRAVIVVQRGDAWGDGVYDIFKKEFEARGGVIFKRIRYDAATTAFGGIMNQVEAAAYEAVGEYGADRVAVQLISLNEAAKIIDFAKYYPTIYELYWFGSENIARNAQLFKSNPVQADKLKLFSPLVTQEENEKYAQFALDYYSAMKVEPDFYASAMYDACWLYALSIIKTWTADTSFVKLELPRIAENYYGASGWCRFNNYGDRYTVDFELWGYGTKDGQTIDVKYGYYDSADGEVTWFTNAGINPPG
jgi:branched-chain amino acid transport system substrate-binding protein